ncbi:Detected protein of unknown function [Hibiscus syriacus]|uniref:Uncharacterized protein n=1 Tax=Hibiscus syriacus TaxID=106335 RepID=A0A6A3B7N5_HIBSY|nr:Detected protein of unknown function [Hibiscus syriacus]
MPELRNFTAPRIIIRNASFYTSEEFKIYMEGVIMEKVTVKIMSYSCKMADITSKGVSLVEDIHRRRQPFPSMDAIYFIQLTKENVVMFLSDVTGRTPLYKKAFVYYSSPIPKELGNKYVHEVPSKTGGPTEKKDVLLEEHDPVWLKLHHAHIADASERLHENMTSFISKNKVAQLQHGSRYLEKSTDSSGIKGFENLGNWSKTLFLVMPE